MFKIDQKQLNKVTTIVILFCAIILGVETYFHRDSSAYIYFEVIDIAIISFFVYEIIFRLRRLEFSLRQLPGACKRKIFQAKKYSLGQEENDGEIIEYWFWLIFDLLLVLLGLISFFRHIVEHPEAILILRLFGILRILRVFELNKSLKNIERKIFSVIPTVITFCVLLFLIIYVYAIIGMYLYDFQKFTFIDFSDLQKSVSSIFTIMSNGWDEALADLKVNAPVINPIVSEFFIFSFFIFSVLITLNVFIAVMTSQIQEKINADLSGIKRDLIIEKEQESGQNQEMLNQKLETVLKELAEIKSTLGSNK